MNSNKFKYITKKLLLNYSYIRKKNAFSSLTKQKKNNVRINKILKKTSKAGKYNRR